MAGPSYEFLNTRVRAMSRALLDADFFEALIGAAGVADLIDLLLDSPYEPELRGALQAAGGIEAAESAIRRNLHAILAKVSRCAATGDPRLFIDRQLARWDLSNVLSLLRGKIAGCGVEEIVAAMLPVAQYDEAQLRELAAEEDVEGVADALTTWNSAFAYVARRVIRAVKAAEEMAGIEQEMYKSYFAWAAADLGADDENQRVFLDLMRMQIDLQNVLMALRSVGYRERDREAPHYAEVPGGHIGGETMERIRSARRLDDAFEALSSTAFSEGVERGILAFGQAHRLSVMERFLECVVISAGSRLFRGNPLGVDVALGFIWRKVSEFLNLRILLRGKAYGVPANTIREELFIP